MNGKRLKQTRKIFVKAMAFFVAVLLIAGSLGGVYPVPLRAERVELKADDALTTGQDDIYAELEGVYLDGEMIAGPDDIQNIKNVQAGTEVMLEYLLTCYIEDLSSKDFRFEVPETFEPQFTEFSRLEITDDYGNIYEIQGVIGEDGTLELTGSLIYETPLYTPAKPNASPGQVGGGSSASPGQEATSKEGTTSNIGTSNIGTSNEGASKPTGGTGADPTESSSVTTDPSEPSTDPKEPVTDPSEPSTDPSEPSTDPSETVTDPSEPSTDPDEPVTDPSEPSTDPDEPVTDPSEPSTDPDEPVTDPSEPSTDPDEPVTDPVEPTADTSETTTETEESATTSAEPTTAASTTETAAPAFRFFNNLQIGETDAKTYVSANFISEESITPLGGISGNLPMGEAYNDSDGMVYISLQVPCYYIGDTNGFMTTAVSLDMVTAIKNAQTFTALLDALDLESEPDLTFTSKGGEPIGDEGSIPNGSEVVISCNGLDINLDAMLAFAQAFEESGKELSFEVAGSSGNEDFEFRFEGEPIYVNGVSYPIGTLVAEDGGVFFVVEGDNTLWTNLADLGQTFQGLTGIFFEAVSGVYYTGEERDVNIPFWVWGNSYSVDTGEKIPAKVSNVTKEYLKDEVVLDGNAGEVKELTWSLKVTFDKIGEVVPHFQVKDYFTSDGGKLQLMNFVENSVEVKVNGDSFNSDYYTVGIHDTILSIDFNEDDISDEGRIKPGDVITITYKTTPVNPEYGYVGETPAKMSRNTAEIWTEGSDGELDYEKSATADYPFPTRGVNLPVIEKEGTPYTPAGSSDGKYYIDWTVTVDLNGTDCAWVNLYDQFDNEKMKLVDGSLKVAKKGEVGTAFGGKGSKAFGITYNGILNSKLNIHTNKTLEDVMEFVIYPKDGGENEGYTGSRNDVLVFTYRTEVLDENVEHTFPATFTNIAWLEYGWLDGEGPGPDYKPGEAPTVTKDVEVGEAIIEKNFMGVEKWGYNADALRHGGLLCWEIVLNPNKIDIVNGTISDDLSNMVSDLTGEDTAERRAGTVVGFGAKNGGSIETFTNEGNPPDFLDGKFTFINKGTSFDITFGDIGTETYTFYVYVKPHKSIYLESGPYFWNGADFIGTIRPNFWVYGYAGDGGSSTNVFSKDAGDLPYDIIDDGDGDGIYLNWNIDINKDAQLGTVRDFKLTDDLGSQGLEYRPGSLNVVFAKGNPTTITEDNAGDYSGFFSNDDGVLELDFSKVNGGLLTDECTVQFQTRIKDDNLGEATGIVEITNTAEFKWNDPALGCDLEAEVSGTATIDKDEENFEKKLLESGGGKLKYEVTINTKERNLKNVEIRDYIPEGLELDVSSVKLDGVIVPEGDIELGSDKWGNYFEITVGDGTNKEYKLEYVCDIVDYAPEYINKVNFSFGVLHGMKETILSTSYGTATGGGAVGNDSTTVTVSKFIKNGNDEEPASSGVKFYLFYRNMFYGVPGNTDPEYMFQPQFTGVDGAKENEAIFKGVPVRDEYWLVEHPDDETDYRAYTVNGDEMPEIKIADVTADGYEFDPDENYRFANPAKTKAAAIPSGIKLTVYNTVDAKPMPELISVSFKKVDAEDKTMGLEGAVFTLYLNDNIMDSATSDDDGVVEFKNVAAGSYIIIETSAPNGYEDTEDVLYQLDVAKNDETGKLGYTLMSSSPESGLSGSSGSYVISNKKRPPELISVSFKKVDAEDKTKGLEGAVFTLYRNDNGNLGDSVGSATSDDDGVVKFDQVAAGSYIIIETSAPNGYEDTEDVLYQLEVAKNNETGKLGYTLTSSSLESGLSESSGSYVISNKKRPPVITVYPISFIKTDGDGDELEDASFTLSILLDGDIEGNQVESSPATSDQDGVVTFNNLTPGKYVLKESLAPQGYVISQDSYMVTLNADGTFTIVGWLNFISSGLSYNNSDEVYEISNLPEEPDTEATTESTTEATTESTTEATTQSTTEATTESTTEATTQSTTEGTTQSTTEGSTDPTEPSENPPETTENTTEPSENPPETTENQTEPSENPPVTTENQTEPSENPPETTENATEPSENPPETTENQTEPSENPPVTTENQTEPSENPPVTTENQTEPSENPPETTENQTEPSENPPETTENMTEPSENPPVTTENITEPSENPPETTESTTEPGLFTEITDIPPEPPITEEPEITFAPEGTPLGVMRDGEYHDIVPNDLGEFWEYAPDGTPLGQWIPNDDGEWEFIDIDTPLGVLEMPKSGENDWKMLIPLAGIVLLVIGLALKIKQAAGHK